MGSEENRYPAQQQQGIRKRWGGCLGGFSCFGAQKGGKRIVPASRVPEANATAAAFNGPQAGRSTNQSTAIAPSILAPPSSPASFTNSALPSTAQSPNCLLSLSANSPGGPSSAMFATGPYAHETQLVSPPVFSAFTTEPSTAPLTPPPELAYLTTPSSPDVPYARFLSSSADLKGTKPNYILTNDLHATYQLHPRSPASSLRSPISRTSDGGLSASFTEKDFLRNWDPSLSPQNDIYPRSGFERLFVHDTTGSVTSQDTNFFCPATYAQYYLDLPHSVGRLSVSKDSDAQSNGGGRVSVSKDSDGHCNGGNGHQNRHIKNPKQDAEELEAYRASFGFSADEIITTSHYVEITDVMDESLTMAPIDTNISPIQDSAEPSSTLDGRNEQEHKTKLLEPRSLTSKSNFVCQGEPPEECDAGNGHLPQRQSCDVNGASSSSGNDILTDDDDIFSKMESLKINLICQAGLSSSDAEIDYRRGRSLRKGRRDINWPA